MRFRRAVVLSAAAALLVAGCTGGDPDDPPTSAVASPTAEPGTTVEDLAASILDGEEVSDAEAGVDEPLARLTVEVAPTPTQRYEVEVVVVALTATAQGTDLTFAVRTADGTDGPRSEHYDWGTTTRSDVRSLELRPDAESALKPYTVMSEPELEQDALCACSDFPKELNGEWQLRAALFPPLQEGASQVAVAFPGAEPVTVPVTWE